MKLFVSEEQFAILKKIFVGPYEVFFFGSRVTGKHHQYSDLDVCLKGKGKIPTKVIAVLNEKCSESDLPFSVDIVDITPLSQILVL